jgi:Leucine-rich repeat (LRR) protein
MRKRAPHPRRRQGTSQHTNLTHLNLDRNQLAAVPESLGNLTNLNLHGNPLHVPEWLDNLINLTYLRMDGDSFLRIVREDDPLLK